MSAGDLGELRVSRMTLGTVQLGMDYGVANSAGKPTAETAFAVLDAARDGGVACLDTARLYGDSENVIGAYRAARPNADFSIVTKFRIDAAKGTSRADIYAQIEGSVNASRGALGIEKLPLLMLHSADDISDFGDAVPNALNELMARGLIGRAGSSVYTGKQIDKMLEYDLLTAVQLPMNLFDRRIINGGQLEALRRKGITVFVRSVFLQGLFFMEELPKGFAKAKPFVKKLREIARREGRSVSELALLPIRDLPGVTSLVLGAETAAQVSENTALINAPSLPPSLSAELEQLGCDAPIEDIMAELLSHK